MNHATIREMIECATDRERRQFKACINVYLDPMRKVRRAMAEGQQKTELGIIPEQERNEQCQP